MCVYPTGCYLIIHCGHSKAILCIILHTVISFMLVASMHYYLYQQWAKLTSLHDHLSPGWLNSVAGVNLGVFCVSDFFYQDGALSVSVASSSGDFSVG